ncbi:MAG: hypothetical protein KDC34_15335 [Saprospiraceae bacterium]|nr:hypothetical protein [Saprospiraceae bacterium]
MYQTKINPGLYFLLVMIFTLPNEVFGQIAKKNQTPHGAVFVEGFGLSTCLSINLSISPSVYLDGKVFPEFSVGYGNRMSKNLKSNLYFSRIGLSVGKEPWFLDLGLAFLFEEVIYRQVQNGNWLGAGFDVWNPILNVGFRRYYFSKRNVYFKGSIYLMRDSDGPFEWAIFSPFPEIYSKKNLLVWWGFSVGISL